LRNLVRQVGLSSTIPYRINVYDVQTSSSQGKGSSYWFILVCSLSRLEERCKITLTTDQDRFFLHQALQILCLKVLKPKFLNNEAVAPEEEVYSVILLHPSSHVSVS
jgi:hypothetical protein